MSKKDGVVPAAGRLIEGTLQPAAKEAGKESKPLGREVGHVTTRAGKLILAPLRGAIWCGEQIVSFIETKVEERTKEIPEEKLQAPDPQITGPSLEALRYCGSKDELADMFAGLIASSMNKDYNSNVHPSFVEVIKQLTRSEAVMLSKWAKTRHDIACADVHRIINRQTGNYQLIIENLTLEFRNVFAEHGGYSNVSISNLLRLGLLYKPEGAFLAKQEAYDQIENDDVFQSQRQLYGKENIRLDKGVITLSPYGNVFLTTCATS